MHPSHPTVQGYFMAKEAGINELLQRFGAALKSGNIKGIPTEYLTAGGGGLLAALLGGMATPGNRLLGALGGGLLGGGLGYLGGYYGKDKIKGWGGQLANYGQQRAAQGTQQAAVNTALKAPGVPAPKDVQAPITMPKVDDISVTEPFKTASQKKLKLKLTLLSA